MCINAFGEVYSFLHHILRYLSLMLYAKFYDNLLTIFEDIFKKT